MKFTTLRVRQYQHFQAELEKSFRQRLGQWSGSVETALENLAEQVDIKQPKQVLQFALDVVRPYLQSLGLRVAKLTAENIEVVLPEHPLHQDMKSFLDEGAVCSASLFAFRKLWKRNAPKGPFSWKVLKFEFEALRELQGPLHIKWNLPTLQREALYAELAETQRALQDTVVHVFNGQDQLVAQVHLHAELRAMKILDWK